MDAKAEILYYNGKAFTGLEYGMEKYYPTWKIEENHPAVQTGVLAFEQLYNKKPFSR